ncbi:MAG: hypothetical protein WC859_10510 [Elusimicrobiota bacterium]|jgi:hypothetical protein
MYILLIVYLAAMILLVRRIDNRLKVAQSSRERAFWIGVRS